MQCKPEATIYYSLRTELMYVHITMAHYKTVLVTFSFIFEIFIITPTLSYGQMRVFTMRNKHSTKIKHNHCFYCAVVKMFSSHSVHVNTTAIQQPVHTMSPICALAGWYRSRCFLGGIISLRMSLCGSMISVMLCDVISDNTLSKCIT